MRKTLTKIYMFTVIGFLISCSEEPSLLICPKPHVPDEKFPIEITSDGAITKVGYGDCESNANKITCEAKTTKGTMIWTYNPQKRELIQSYFPLYEDEIMHENCYISGDDN